MKRTFLLAIALAVAPTVVHAQAATPAVPPAGATLKLTEGTPVVVVGEVSSQPKDFINERKMQVAIGPGKVDYTLHLSDAKLYGIYGEKLDEKNLADKMWVRAEGTVMDDPRRIKVGKLQVIGKDLAGLKQTGFYRTGFDQGYVMALAGSRQIFPETRGAVYTPGPLMMVGLVSSDTGPLENTRKIQVDSAGNTWTVQVAKDTPVFDAKGQKISVHEIAKGQWVRVHGWQTDDLRIRGARLENIGKDEAYRTSGYFRTASPIGYVERMPGTGVKFSPVSVTGTITAWNPETGLLTVRDETGKDRVFAMETILVYINNQPADVGTLKSGQRVTIQGSEIQF